MVVAAFIGPRPEGLQVCHNNGVHYDNRAINLRYGTPKENSQDSVKHGALVQQQKVRCIWGHPLESPNLVEADIRIRGKRRCRACNIAMARRQRAPDLDHQLASNWAFIQIEKGSL